MLVYRSVFETTTQLSESFFSWTSPDESIGLVFADDVFTAPWNWHVFTTHVQSATEWTASVHTLHMSQRNVTRVQIATEWTASVHTLHMSQRNVTRVQSATEWTASVQTLHMPKHVM